VLRAIDSSTGRQLWSFATGSRIATAPAVYRLDGNQYLAVVTGGSSIAEPKGSKLEVFALDGKMDEGKELKAPAPFQLPPIPEGLRQYLTPPPDQAPKTVNLLLNGAQGGAGGGLNFNGFTRGDMTISIPQGWNVNVTFKNVSPQTPHSATVTSRDGLDQASGQRPAFKGSTTPDPEAGILSGIQYMNFKAGKAGNYALVCAVPGHTPGGMWANFRVGPPDSRPSIRTPDETFVLEEPET
jgi:hypothetical protein